jgi:hypothetical protein
MFNCNTYGACRHPAADAAGGIPGRNVEELDLPRDGLLHWAAAWLGGCLAVAVALAVAATVVAVAVAAVAVFAVVVVAVAVVAVAVAVLVAVGVGVAMEAAAALAVTEGVAVVVAVAVDLYYSKHKCTFRQAFGKSGHFTDGCAVIFGAGATVL